MKKLIIFRILLIALLLAIPLQTVVDTPVRADVFGYSTEGSSSWWESADHALGSIFTTPADIDTVTSMEFYVQADASPTINAKALIVLQSTLEIVANGVSNSGTLTASSTEWKELTFGTPPTLAASTDYIFMIIVDAGSGNYALKYDAGDSGQGNIDYTNDYDTPANLGSTTTNTNKCSIKINYTTSGSPPDPPTNVSATDGDHTDKVTITWTKSDGATGYKIYRDDELVDTLGDVATYDDTGADAPTITAGDSVATDGTYIAHAALSLSGSSVANGTTHTYKLKATNENGDSGDSSTDTGYRGHGTHTYQWQMSSGDSDADYSNIEGATTASYNATEAPANGDGRYFKCVQNATGATEQTSTANRGYRAYYTIAKFMGIDIEDIASIMGIDLP